MFKRVYKFVRIPLMSGRPKWALRPQNSIPELTKRGAIAADQFATCRKEMPEDLEQRMRESADEKNKEFSEWLKC